MDRKTPDEELQSQPEVLARIQYALEHPDERVEVRPLKEGKASGEPTLDEA